MLLHSSKSFVGKLYQDINVKFHVRQVIKYDPFDIVIRSELIDNGSSIQLLELEKLQQTRMIIMIVRQ